MENQKIIVAGYVADGVTFYGPFEDSEIAIEWASQNLDVTWHVSDLHREAQ